jgi:hypothetical protein
MFGNCWHEVYVMSDLTVIAEVCALPISNCTLCDPVAIYSISCDLVISYCTLCDPAASYSTLCDVIRYCMLRDPVAR